MSFFVALPVSGEHAGVDKATWSRYCIWEMRLKGRSGISRALHVTAVGRRVVIVRVFVKKTEKTPRRKIDLALSRAKSVQRGR